MKRFPCLANDSNCKYIDFGEEEFGYECFYPKQNIVNAYEHFRKSRLTESPDDIGYKNLRVMFEVGEIYIDEFEDMRIYYIWTSNETTLSVDLFYTNQTIHAAFIQKNSGMEFTITFLPKEF
jgi:hypothetical protein